MSNATGVVNQQRPPAYSRLSALLARVRQTEPRLLIAVALPVVVGTFIALWNLGGKPLWYDETFEALLVMHPAKKFAYWVATFETSGTFYHSLLWVWKFIGTNEFALRLPSVVFGVLALPVTFAVGRRFLTVPWAFLATLLLAVSPLWLSHAQEARPYALFLLMSGVSTWALLRATEQASRVRWAIYTLATVLAIWSHLMMAFVVLAQVIALAVHPHARSWWRGAAASVAICALSALPIAYSISHANQHRWDWLQGATGQGLWEGFRHLASDPGFLLTDLWLLLWGVGIAIGLRRFFANRLTAWPIVVIALISVLAVIGPWLGSFFKEMYAPRYIFEALPPMILLGTLSLSVVRPWLIGAAIGVLLLGSWIYVVATSIQTLGWPDFRTAVRDVVAEGTPADGLAYFYNGPFEPGAQYEYRYELSQIPDAADRPTMILLPATTDPLAQRVDTAIAAYQRIFLIGTPEGMNDVDSGAAISEIERSFALTREYDAFGLDVRLYTRSAAVGH